MSMLRQLIANRSVYEAIFTIFACLVVGAMIGLISGLALKFQIVVVLSMLFLGFFILIPQKKMFCLILWIFLHPLGIEKILYEAPGFYEGLHGLELTITAADILIGMLLGILIVERLFGKRDVFVIGKAAYCFAALFLWAIVSYIIHRIFYYDTFLQSTPYGLLYLAKLAIFCVVILSTIQTRAELIWVLIAIVFILILQSILVYMSFVTGEPFNFTRLLGQGFPLQSYMGAEGAVKRAAGTFGTPNQQASYQVILSFLLLSFAGFKRGWVRYLGLITFMMSMLALIFTFSRGAWLCATLAVLLCFTILYYKKLISQTGWLIFAASLLAMGVVIAALSRPIIDRLTNGDDGATDSRIRMAALAKDLFLEYPFIGVGVNGYAEAGLALYPPEHDDSEWVSLGNKPIVPPLGRVELVVFVKPDGERLMGALPVHNKYLLVASELGAVGLVIWLLMLYFFYREIRVCLKHPSFFGQYIGIAGSAVLIIVSTYSMLDLFNDDRSVINLIFPLLIISAASRILSQLETRTQSNSSAMV